MSFSAHINLAKHYVSHPLSAVLCDESGVGGVMSRRSDRAISG